MPEMIENHMLIDAYWEHDTPVEIIEKLRNPGYKEYGTGIFVAEEDAYQYAMERISQDEDLQKEFKETVVEWFYSGNWIKED